MKDRSELSDLLRRAQDGVDRIIYRQFRDMSPRQLVEYMAAHPDEKSPYTFLEKFTSRAYADAFVKAMEEWEQRTLEKENQTAS